MMSIDSAIKNNKLRISLDGSEGHQQLNNLEARLRSKIQVVHAFHIFNVDTVGRTVHQDATTALQRKGVTSTIASIFRQAKAKGRTWKRLQLKVGSAQSSVFRSILLAAAGLFEEICLVGDDRGVVLKSSVAQILLDAMAQRKGKLEALSFLGIWIGQDSATLLSQGLRKTTTLKKFSISYSPGSFYRQELDSAMKKMIRGLYINQSIQEFCLSGTKLRDPTLESIISSLKNKNLTSLSLAGNNCGRQSLQALASLLSSPKCQMQSLDLSNQSATFADKLDITLLVEGMKRNSSLRHVKLSDNYLDSTDLTTIWEAIEDNQCQSLEHWDLSYNRIDSIPSLTQASDDESPRQLRILDLSANPVLKQHDLETKTRLKEFVQANRRLGSLGHHYCSSEVYCEDTEFMMDCNASGRSSLLPFDGEYPSREILLSVWPTVLARSNCHFDDGSARQANAMHALFSSLLVGPMGGSIR